MSSSCRYYAVGAPGSVVEPQMQKPDLHKIVTFDVVGKGVEPEAALTMGQAKLLAERAAIADGYRQFVEKLRGVLVESYTESGSGMVSQDMIKLKTQSWLRGVEIIEVTRGEYGITQAHMQLRINFTRKGMIWWPTGLGQDVSAS